MKTESVATAARQRRKNGQEKELWGRKFKVVDNGLDQAEICSFLGALIEDNNILFKKLQHMDSLMELAENALAEARKQAQRITLETEEEANKKASALISDAEERAKAESDRITSEAMLKAEKAAQDRLQEAAKRAEEIETRAQEEASSLLFVANQKADELVKQRMARAQEEAHEVVKKSKEHFKKTYQKLLESLDSTDISAKLSTDDISCNSEESVETTAPHKVTIISFRIPLKFLPGFLRQKINRS